MSACVNTPLFPSGTAYPCEPVGDCHRRVAPPEACPKTARGRRELKREEPNPRRESAPAGGEAEDALLAIACGGFQPPVFAACLARRFEGPPRWVPRHQLLRRHRERWRQAVGIALGACPLMDVAPPDVHEVLPEAGPGPRAGDTGEGSAGASIPGPHEAGAARPGRYHRLGSGTWLALHARAAHGAWRAWGRGLVQRRSTVTLADQGEGLAVLAAKPRRLAGAGAAVAHHEAVTRRKPAHQASPQPPGEGRRSWMPPARPAIPCRGTGHGDQDGESPRPCRQRPVDEPRPHPPLLAPTRGRSAVRRPHPLALPSLATPGGPGCSVTGSSPARSTG